MQDSTKLFDTLPLVAMAAAYAVGALLGSVFVRNTLKRALARGSRMDPNLRHVLERSVPRPAGAAFFLFAVSVGSRFFPIPPKVELLTKHIIPFLFGTLAILMLMRVALSAIGAYGESNPSLKSTAGIARAITWIIGLAVIAVLVSDAVGISLAPALTALGVGSLSVALALQDTLSNFFAGVYLLLDKPIRPGEYIRLDGGQEGYVDTIGWRSTHLRTLAASFIIVPNATLSKAVITNFGIANPRLVLATPIDVAMNASPEAAEAAIQKVVAGLGDIAGLDANQKPFQRFSIGDRGLTYTIYVAVAVATDGSLVQQEIRKRAIASLHAANIPLADPSPFAKRAP